MSKINFLCTVFILMFVGFGSANAQITWNIGDPNPADVTATLSNDTLYISGTGAMKAYVSGSAVPWYENHEDVSTVVITNGVTNIGTVFVNFFYLTSIIIPNSVISIGVAAFGNCRSLTSIIIPNSVISIETGAFVNCSNLTTVTNLNPVPQNINSSVFGNVNISAATLIVPCGSLSAYQAAPVWKDFGTIIEDCLSLTDISNVNFSCPEQVTITYDLNTTQPVDVTLYYSHNKHDWLPAQTVTGDITAQTTGTGKTIIWNNYADNVQYGKFYFKVEADTHH